MVEYSHQTNMRIQHILLTAAVSASAVSAQAQTANSDSLTASYQVGVESAYVFRGHEVSDNSLQSNVVLNYDGFYTGAYSYLPIGDKAARKTQVNELDLVAGYKLTEDKWSFDLGYTYYWYTDNTPGYNRSNEFKAVASYSDVGFGISPSVGINYDISLEALTVEAAVSKTFDLGQWAKNLSVVTVATVGATDADDSNSDQNPASPSNGYTYASVTANLVYAIDKSFSVYAGPRVSWNNDEGNSTTGGAKDTSLLWWGAGISGSF